MRTSGWSRWTRSMPSGAAINAIRRTEVAPAPFTVSIGKIVRELHVVLDRLERLLVAEEADEPDAGARDERQHGVEHADPGAQDRADGDLLPGDPAGGHVLERRLDLDLLVRQVLRRLVDEEQRQLVHELPEHLRRRRDVAQEPELVLDERMRDLGDLSGRGRVQIGARVHGYGGCYWARRAVTLPRASAAGTAPSRSTRGSSPVRSSTVDGVPGSSPPSTTAATASRISRGTSPSRRGSGSPWRFALVAATTPTASRTSR